MRNRGVVLSWVESRRLKKPAGDIAGVDHIGDHSLPPLSHWESGKSYYPLEIKINCCSSTENDRRKNVYLQGKSKRLSTNQESYSKQRSVTAEGTRNTYPRTSIDKSQVRPPWLERQACWEGSTLNFPVYQA